MRDLKVEGRLLCISDAADLTLSPRDCEAGGGSFALRTAEGAIYRFDPYDQRAGIFRDPQVHDMTLRVHGQLSGEWLTIVHLHSLVEGEPHKIYYRCEVCNITAYAPGPCWCCQDDFEFRQTPVTEGQDPEAP